MTGLVILNLWSRQMKLEIGAVLLWKMIPCRMVEIEM